MKNISLMLVCGLWVQAVMSAAIPSRDPTRPPTNLLPANAAFQMSGNLVVTAIFIYPNDRLALINGRLMRIDDKVGEFTISSITPYTVELIDTQQTKQILPLVTPIKKER